MARVSGVLRARGGPTIAVMQLAEGVAVELGTGAARYLPVRYSLGRRAVHRVRPPGRGLGDRAGAAGVVRRLVA